jgi:hypothetical protein
MIITKNCRKCGVRFEQPTRQTRPTEYCSVRCNYSARRIRKSAAARAKYAREKALGFAAEEHIEGLNFGA